MVAGAKPVSVTTLEYVLDVSYVVESLEHASDVRDVAEVPY